MHLVRKFPQRNANLMIIVRTDTEERLKTTCFRGTNVQLAGNFFRWDSARALFSDEQVLDEFMEEIENSWEEREFATQSITITHDELIGWDSTDDFLHYQPEDLELFEPSRKSRGLRVKTSCTEIYAPQTDELTIVYQLKEEQGRPVVIIFSIYPGRDIGELRGDVSAREEIVFFDWNHPGETV